MGGKAALRQDDPERETGPLNRVDSYVLSMPFIS
jgi:hypothetical protein